MLSLDNCKEALETLKMIDKYLGLAQEMTTLKAEIEQKIEKQKRRRAMLESRN